MNDNKKAENCQSIVFAVYVIWCAPTNKFYVGVTRQKYVATRIRQHRRGKKQFIDKEIKKIGWDGNFDYWIVEENIPSNQISDCEKRWIEFFSSVYPHSYNKTFGGIGNIAVSDDTREIMRQNALARGMSGENNPMYGKPPANKGVPHTEEERAKMSAAQTGEKNGFYGKHHTEEAKEKNRQAHLGKHPSDETRAKMSESHKSENLSEETRAKMSASRTGEKNHFYGKHHTAESIEKNRQAHLGQVPWNKGKSGVQSFSAETRAKMSASAKARWAKKKAAKENSDS